MRWLTWSWLGLLAACSSVVPTDEEGGAEATSSADTTTGGGPPAGRSTSGWMTESGSVGGDRTSGGVTSSVDPTPGDPTSGEPTSGEPTSGEPTSGDDTSTGPTGLLDIHPIPESVCLPPDLHGPPIETHRSGWTAFEGCIGGELLLQTFGEPPLISQDQLTPVYEQYGQSLLGLPGAYSQSVVPCCTSPEEVCLGVLADPKDFDIGESLAYLNELFALLPEGCVGVKVILQEP